VNQSFNPNPNVDGWIKLNPRLVCHQLLTHEVHLVPEEMGNPPN
jgi:hypothetical protein